MYEIDTPCIEDTGGHVNSHGYRRHVYKGIHHRATGERFAHRVAWTYANGKIPEGAQVLHKCHNPRCSNAEHLKLGTHEENMKDKAKLGRAKGTGKHRNFSCEEITDIRSGEGSNLSVSRKYGVTEETIHRIRHRHTYAHI